MSIELAPNCKRSLTLASPLILASGSMDGAGVGAVVTFPLTSAPRSAGPGARVVEVPGGFMLRTGAANPGLSHVLRDHARAWAASPCHIIVAFAAQAESQWPDMAARLERVPGVGGIELHLNPAMDAAGAIRATRAATDLPVLAKLDLDNAREIAAGCVHAGANSLVIGRAPRGMASVDGRAWYGRLYSPAVQPIALRVLADVAALELGVPLVACGGVHAAGDVRAFLAAGAVAVEIDSAAWVDPQIPGKIAKDLGALTYLEESVAAT
jgi:dihydroorotate dehydrogenase (NAD+) catalytic subunit